MLIIDVHEVIEERLGVYLWYGLGDKLFLIKVQDMFKLATFLTSLHVLSTLKHIGYSLQILHGLILFLNK